MDVHDKLDDLTALVESARSMPMSASCILNRGEVLALLDEMRAELPEEFDEAERILREHGAYDIEDRVVQWRSEGWNGYNPNAEPYSFEEVERERTRYSAGANPTTGTQPRM